MERDHFRRNLHRIGLCLALCTSRVAAADQLSKTSGLIESVRQGMQQFETQSRPNTAFDEAKRKVQEAVRAIESMESMSGCDEQAIVYLGSDALGELASSVVFQVGSNEGIVHFSFLSGTNLSAVVAAVNTFENYLYVHAAIAEENSSRVELRSNFWGSDKFVMVKQTYGPPIVYPAATGWKPISEWTDYGCAFGSPNCATPASIFLLTKSNLVTNGAGAVTLFVVGNAGMQQFTFASGSSQANIIAALNTFDFNVGVSARQCAVGSPGTELEFAL